MLRLIRLFTVIALALALSIILYATMRPAQALSSTPGGGGEGFSITTDDGLSLTLSQDGQVVALAMDDDPLPEDGSPLVIPFDPPSAISWIRFTVDESVSTLVGLAELVVNGPPDGFTYEKPEPPTTETPSP